MLKQELNDRQLVQAINRAIDLRTLRECARLGALDINHFIQLLDEGQLVFSGELTGFHIKQTPEGDVVLDCGVEDESEDSDD
jgi:hypothetical protein